MIGGSPIAYLPVGLDTDEIIYTHTSRVLAGGTFQIPAAVPETLDGINWDDGSIILWDDGTPIYWDS